MEHGLDLVSEVLFLNLDSNSEDNKEINNIHPMLKEGKTKEDILFFFVFFLESIDFFFRLCMSAINESLSYI